MSLSWSDLPAGCCSCWPTLNRKHEIREKLFASVLLHIPQPPSAVPQGSMSPGGTVWQRTNAHQARTERSWGTLPSPNPCSPTSTHEAWVSPANVLDKRYQNLGVVALWPVPYQPLLDDCLCPNRDFPGDSDGKASVYNARDPGSIPGSGRSPGEGNGNTLQYSCLENPMTEEPGRLSDFTFTFIFTLCPNRAPQMALVVKNPPTNAGDSRDAPSISGLGRSPEGGNRNPLQYSCLENSMNRGAWLATVCGFTKSQIQLSTQHVLPYPQLRWPRFYSSLLHCLQSFNSLNSTDWIQQTEFMVEAWIQEFHSLESCFFLLPCSSGYLCCTRTMLY